jgi:hypothetical protein
MSDGENVGSIAAAAAAVAAFVVIFGDRINAAIRH